MGRIVQMERAVLLISPSWTKPWVQPAGPSLFIALPHVHYFKHFCTHACFIYVRTHYMIIISVTLRLFWKCDWFVLVIFWFSAHLLHSHDVVLICVERKQPYWFGLILFPFLAPWIPQKSFHIANKSHLWCSSRHNQISFSCLLQLQETVKRKLDSARSPLNGEQNGICDGGGYSPTTKRVRKDGSGGLDSLTGLPNNNNNNNVPPISPLHHQMDIKPILGGPNTSTGNNTTNSNGNHVGQASDELGKNGGSHLSDMKLNGALPDLEDSFSLLKDLKQEPLDDGGGMESSDPQSLSNQNKLFSDINLNDQEWQELIDELANTVPEDDMHDLFNEDFEDKKEAEFGRPANNQTPGPQEAAGNTTAPGGGAAPVAALPPPPQPPQGGPQVPMGSPQVSTERVNITWQGYLTPICCDQPRWLSHILLLVWCFLWRQNYSTSVSV